jgi:hypothetical protein
MRADCSRPATAAVTRWRKHVRRRRNRVAVNQPLELIVLERGETGKHGKPLRIPEHALAGAGPRGPARGGVNLAAAAREGA